MVCTCLCSFQFSIAIDENSAASEITLFIPEASLEDAGYYMCSAQLEGVLAIAEAYVDVIAGKVYIHWH